MRGWRNSNCNCTCIEVEKGSEQVTIGVFKNKDKSLPAVLRGRTAHPATCVGLSARRRRR
jgi:hypothetical protein